MKKVKNSADIHPKPGQELSKKLYRSATEQAKHLDDARSCARSVGELFTPSLQIQRSKFCDYCERLIFSDPIFYGKKGEELIWRKGYYDIISTAKKLKKKSYTQDEICNIETHINAGIGFYHRFIARLQCEFNLNLKTSIDFPIECKNEFTKDDSNPKDDSNSGNLRWADQCVYQCLIYLGDLNRYKIEIYPKQHLTFVYRYYLQAINYKPDHGMPHNQMGTLAMSQNKILDAVYHYMRCLECPVSFEGTTNNLQSLFDRNSKMIEDMPLNNVESNNHMQRSEHLKCFITRFLLLIDIWYFNKKVNKVYNLCHQTYKDLKECLSHNKALSDVCKSPTESISSDTTDSSTTTSEHLTDDMIFKMVVICLLCVSKLQEINSNLAATVTAFILAIYSQLVQNVTTHIQDSVLNYPLPENEVKFEHSNGIVKDLLRRNKKRSASKLRRKKVLHNDSDSEISEDEQDPSNSIHSSDDDSFNSDSEDALAELSEDDVDIEEEKLKNSISENNSDKSDKSSNDSENKVDIVRKVKRMDVNDMLEIVTEEGSLHSINILNDWLMQDAEIIKSCGTNTRSLLKQITDMLNLVNINVKSSKLNSIQLNISDVIKHQEKIPLSENVVLKGVGVLAVAHKLLDWNYTYKRSFNPKEESVVRIVKMMAFGKFLTNIEETGITFDEKRNVFVCKCDLTEPSKVPNPTIEDFELQENEYNAQLLDKPDKDVDGKNQLMKMKHMGQLWLASEVRALESRVRDKTSLSPYLVLDTDALIKYTFMVKHLVSSRKFIVLIPSAVVSALDYLKREQSEARDAIRWLESQFHRGNRFFRAQRPQERAPIPFIKYPKKKDKEMCIYIEIIECCYYLAEQQKGASNLVTLLIGNHNVLTNGENKDFSYVGLAQSAGVSIESITHFYGKWKKNYKGKR